LKILKKLRRKKKKQFAALFFEKESPDLGFKKKIQHNLKLKGGYYENGRI